MNFRTKMKSLIAFLVSFCWAQVAFQETYGPAIVGDLPYETVNLPLNGGTVRGKKISILDHEVEVYRGIPYAKPPKRFEHSELIGKFSNEINGMDLSPSCFQNGLPAEMIHDYINNNMMSEDCLMLDIYRPVYNSVNKPGIIIWIHGGGLNLGSKMEYSGLEQAAQQGNIVVIINYRLAMYGFLNYYNELEKKTVGGNYGLKDIQVAMEFVYNHAEELGGNQNNIMINGQSGGAWAIGALLLEPKTSTLANVALAQSGGALNGFSLTLMYKQETEEFNKNIDTLCDTAECESATTTAQKWEIIKNMDALDLWLKFSELLIYPGPITNDGIFYTENVMEKFKRGDLETSMTYVVGINSFEGNVAYFLPDFNETNYWSSVEEMVGWILSMLVPTYASNELSNAEIADKYTVEFNGYLSEPVTKFTFAQMVAIGEQVYGDYYFLIPAMQEVDAYAKAGHENVYLYYMDFDGMTDVVQMYQHSCCGVGHGKELYYTFGVTRNQTMFAALTGQSYTGLSFSPENWEMELTQYLDEEWSLIVNMGKPTNWSPYTLDTHQQTVLRNTDSAVIISEEDGAKLSRSQYAIDNFISISAPATTEPSTTTSSAMLVSTSIFYITLVILKLGY